MRSIGRLRAGPDVATLKTHVHVRSVLRDSFVRAAGARLTFFDTHRNAQYATRNASCRCPASHLKCEAAYTRALEPGFTPSQLIPAYYFHRFYEFQPDLNVGERIMSFWLQLGVTGSRIDALARAEARSVQLSSELSSRRCDATLTRSKRYSPADGATEELHL